MIVDYAPDGQLQPARCFQSVLIEALHSSRRETDGPARAFLSLACRRGG